MKKLLPIAIIGAAVGAVSYYFLKNNQEHLEQTLDALEELEQNAQDTVKELSESIKKDKEA